MDALREDAARAYVAATALLDPSRFAFWEASGLAMPELRVMHALLRAPHRPIGELADELLMKRSTISGMVDRLVQRGLIERSDHPADRRVVLLMLTADGEQTLEQATADAAAFLEAVLQSMTDGEVRDLTRLLDQFVSAVEAVTQGREAVT